MSKGTLVKSLIKDSGGSGGGGSFPTIVTDSGSSLPSASGYQEGDTFLNTRDKKLYTTQVGGYTLNTEVTNQVTFNTSDGAVSGFYFTASQYYNTYFAIYRMNQAISWSGSGVKIRIHFKLTDELSSSHLSTLFSNTESASGTPGESCCTDIVYDNGKLYLSLYTSQYGQSSVRKDVICETTLAQNTEYYLEIEKSGNSATATLSTEGYGINPIETKTIETQDHTPSTVSSRIINYGRSFANNVSFGGSFENGVIYLADSTGEFVVADTTSLLWDSGTSLTDKTEYADNTNGALYLYENSELVKIGGGLTKKVYTISADDNSTLDVSSDFTKVVDVLKNGVELALTDDYTISSGVITFVTALSTTDKITVKGE